MQKSHIVSNLNDKPKLATGVHDFKPLVQLKAESAVYRKYLVQLTNPKSPLSRAYLGSSHSYFCALFYTEVYVHTILYSLHCPSFATQCTKDNGNLQLPQPSKMIRAKKKPSLRKGCSLVLGSLK